MTSSQIKSVLITGCARGIGFCTAQMLKARGYRVFATVRKQADAAQLQALGFETEILDLTDTDSIDNAVNNILQKTAGQLNALVNNAGYLVLGAIEDLSIDVFKEQFETNFFGTIYLTQKIIPIMRKQAQGRIVFISSINGFIATPFVGAYTASKFALEGLVETLAMELNDSPIRVSLIEPGFIETDFRTISLPTYTESNHQIFYQQLSTIKNQYTEKETLPFIKPPEAVGEKIILALESRHAKLRYRVGGLAHLMAIFKYLFPSRMRINLILNIMKRDMARLIKQTQKRNFNRF